MQFNAIASLSYLLREISSYLTPPSNDCARQGFNAVGNTQQQCYGDNDFNEIGSGRDTLGDDNSLESEEWTRRIEFGLAFSTLGKFGNVWIILTIYVLHSY